MTTFRGNEIKAAFLLTVINERPGNDSPSSIPLDAERKDILFEQIIRIHTGKTISYTYGGHSVEHVPVTCSEMTGRNDSR